jgi:hypothetical protein
MKMSESTRIRALRIALIATGAIFIFGIYPLAIVVVLVFIIAHVEHFLPGADRGPPVAAQELAEPDRELDRDRLIEPVLVADSLYHRWVMQKMSAVLAQRPHFAAQKESTS